MRGRKPKPTALHNLHGTLRPTDHASRASEPIAEGDLTDAPAWMTPGQKEDWRYAVRHAPANVLKRIDAGLLAAWVIAHDQHRTATVAQAKLDAKSELPLLVKNAKGEAVASPYVGVINRAALRMVKAASELGFSPASRPRLAGGTSAAPLETASPWSKFSVVNGGRLGA